VLPAEALASFGSSVVADSLRDLGYSDRTASYGVRPVRREHVAAGRARTAAFEVVASDDDRGFLPLAAFIDSCRQGEVLVLGDAVGASPGSVWGEICSTAASQRGCAGVVIDGYMRDQLAIERMDLPVFSRGAFPQDCLGRSMVVEGRTDAICGGVPVSTGDWVVADADGVVFVPPEILSTVLETASEKRRAEQALLDAVAAGESLAEAVKRVGTL
jgi:4-hydroxy-4-methyl-2-oxoglutarate aldolase